MKDRSMKYRHNILSLTIIFIITYIQYKYIGFYHDDYGYASLSYATNNPTSQVTIENILSYLHWHYLNWGGRILFFFFQIIAMQLGMSHFMLIQSIINCMILFFTYKTLCLIYEAKNNSTRYVLLASFLSLYLLIRLNVYRDTSFWATASAIYIWPLLPLSIGIYLSYIVALCENRKKIIYCTIVLCFFMAGFSQEQIALASVLFMPAFALFVLQRKTHAYKGLIACGILPALTGFAILYSAPGNYVRMVAKHEPLPSLSTVFAGFTEQSQYILSNIFKSSFGVAFCLLLALIVLAYSKNKNVVVRTMPFWVMALASAAVIYISPLKDSRMMYPSIFWLLASVSVALPLWHHSYGKITTVAAIALFLFACRIHYQRVFSGYYENYPTLVLNDSNLQKAARLSPPPTVVTFYKLPNGNHSNCMPYDQRPYIEPWIKSYYKLPASTIFEYKDSPYKVFRP